MIIKWIAQQIYALACSQPPLSHRHPAPHSHSSLLLPQVSSVPPGDSKIFTEYIFPSLSLLPMDSEVAVQAEYAGNIAELALTAQAFLERVQQQRRQQPREAGDAAAVNFDEEASWGGSVRERHRVGVILDRGGIRGRVWCPHGHRETFGAGTTDAPPLLCLLQMGYLRMGVERAVHGLLTSTKSEPVLALLPRLRSLAGFMGKKETTDVLVPLLFTFFNSQQWQARGSPPLLPLAWGSARKV
jgi:hypothetical protein